MQHLDKRLSVIAGLFTPGGRGIDVGTDHGYLAVALVQGGKAQSMLATDVNPGPLQSARNCIAENGLTDRIDTRLADGLEGLPLSGFTDIIIAGMGGQLISSILSQRVGELAGKNLLLQPMTQAPALRQWLCENGFSILLERCAVAAGKAYTVIQARFTGEKTDCSPLFALVGRTPEDGGEDAGVYLQTLLSREQKRLKGLKAAASPDEGEIRQSEELVAGIKEILARREKEKGASV